jgi:hypothetical protein
LRGETQLLATAQAWEGRKEGCLEAFHILISFQQLKSTML